jgi:aminoglycoside phosphotransferase (APT) family kinase protein
MLDWQSDSDDFKRASEDEIHEIFQLAATNGRVRRVSEQILAKKTALREFENQVFAWKTLNGASLRVPEPIRYVHGLVEGENGIMIMEFLDGCSWDNVEKVDESCTNVRVHKAIQHMHKATVKTTGRHVIPGPLDGGHAEGFPWGRGQKEAEVTFTSLQDLMACIEKRLVQHAKRNKQEKTRSINLEGQKLAVCHGDLAPRNVLKLVDGQVALLDWEWMCVYPAIFDLAGLSMLDKEHPHEKQKVLIECLTLDACLERSRGDVEEDMTTLRIVDRESLRYHFG